MKEFLMYKENSMNVVIYLYRGGKNEHESNCGKDFLIKNVGKLSEDVEVFN